MTGLVTVNLALLADSPGGVDRLRSLIVDQAVSGRLMLQDPADEPAALLAARLVAAKAQAIAEGARKQKPLEVDAATAQPFEVPAHWTWQLLDTLLLITGGVTLGRKLAGQKLVTLPYLRVANVQRGFLSLDKLKDIDVPEDEVAKYALQAGDLLITEGGDWDKVGRTAIWRGDITPCLHQNHVFRARACSDEFTPRWAELYLNSAPARSYFAGSSKQTTNLASINMTQLRSCAFPLPPLAEQHRIVAKVDELMALCDRLEARQQDAEAAHARLVQALLDSLTQALNAEEFQAAWHQLAGQFNTVFASSASVDSLRASVLQLGVLGRLGTSRAIDELATRLIERLGAKPISDAVDPLPDNWCWTKFSVICSIRSALVRPEEHLDAPQVAPDCIEKGTGRLLLRRTVRESGVRGPNSRFSAGQIVYSKIRPSLSKVVLVDFDGLCSADMYPIDSKIDARYQLYLMLSEQFLAQVRAAENRVKMPKLNQESLNEFVVPLPPLAEQHRIVAKVTELLALCDQLKARIAAARAKHAQLAQALVAQAVAA